MYMKTHQSAWAPSNISLLFKVIPHEDPNVMTALGSGLTVNEGATVTVSYSDTFSISYNDTHIDLPPVRHLVSELTHESVAIDITSPFTLGSGFGISGASTIATAYALNTLLEIRKTPEELDLAAHRAEVISKTGLGDVGNQRYGGCCVKFTATPVFDAKRFPFTGFNVYVRSWGKIPTPTILSNAPLIAKLDTVGDAALQVIQARMSDASFSFADLLDIANIFTKDSGLIDYAPHAHEVITHVQRAGGHAAMIILGDAVVSDTPFEGSMRLTISQDSVRLL
jgi:pantoate kinase